MHLLSGFAAIVLAGFMLLMTFIGARVMEARFIHTPAARALPYKDQKAALQAEAFRQSDLLPVYGSSELQIANTYRAGDFFHDYPTGFTIYPTGDLATSALIWVQALASLGNEMEGRKVVFSISPQMYFRPMIDPEFYAGNFSELHASSLVFQPRFSPALKRAIARRMLDYPDTLLSRPWLKSNLERLTRGALIDDVMNLPTIPSSAAQNALLRFQDHWDALTFLPLQGDRSLEPRRVERTIDWTNLIDAAERQAVLAADNNPFGFYRDYWLEQGERISRERNSWSDEKFLATLDSAREWTDLELLLQGVQELHGRPLILSMPIHGAYYDYIGVSRQARQAYYDRLKAVGARFGVLVIDFDEFDEDRTFLRDPQSHPSEKGWIYMNQMLDAFAHDRIQ